MCLAKDKTAWTEGKWHSWTCRKGFKETSKVMWPDWPHSISVPQSSFIIVILLRFFFRSYAYKLPSVGNSCSDLLLSRSSPCCYILMVGEQPSTVNFLNYFSRYAYGNMMNHHCMEIWLAKSTVITVNSYLVYCSYISILQGNFRITFPMWQTAKHHVIMAKPGLADCLLYAAILYYLSQQLK